MCQLFRMRHEIKNANFLFRTLTLLPKVKSSYLKIFTGLYFRQMLLTWQHRGLIRIIRNRYCYNDDNVTQAPTVMCFGTVRFKNYTV